MATLYVSEYQYLAGSQSTPESVPAGKEPNITVQTLAIGAGSVQSLAFNALTRFIRVHADSVCSIAFGKNPTATTSSERLAANQTEFFGVFPGDAIAVIANT